MDKWNFICIYVEEDFNNFINWVREKDPRFLFMKNI